jgi:hypothetical protein
MPVAQLTGVSRRSIEHFRGFDHKHTAQRRPPALTKPLNTDSEPHQYPVTQWRQKYRMINPLRFKTMTFQKLAKLALGIRPAMPKRGMFKPRP